MTRKVLQVLGGLTLLGVLAAGAASVFLVKERFTVNVLGERSQLKTGPDPVALLRDDVASLRQDLSALTQALSKNFEALASRADEADAAQRASTEQALAAMGAKVDAAVKASSDALSNRRSAEDAAAAQRTDAARQEWLAALSDLAARVDRLGARLAAAPADAAPSKPAASPTLPPAAPPVTRVEPARVVALPPPSPVASAGAARTAATASAPAPAPTPPPSPTPAPAPRKKGFLSFQLPSEGVSYDQLTKFEILGSLSRVGFDGKSTMHDFTGVTSEVDGTFVARLTRPGEATTGNVRAQAATIDTGLPDRDQEMQRTLDTARFPTIEFALTAFSVAESDPKTMAFSGTARGKLTIHGVTHEVSVPLRCSVDSSRRLVIEGEATLKLTDYGITPPRKIGIISMDDQVRIWLALRARAVGRAE